MQSVGRVKEVSLRNEIWEIEEALGALQDKLRELRIKVDSLEVQNARLLERLSDENIRSEGVEELTKLYDEGYHICSTYFAQSRNGEECLFCQSFLKGNV